MEEAVSNTTSLSLPSGFTAVEYAEGTDYTRRLLDEINNDDVEVWLIQAPLGADLKALNGQRLKLDKRSVCKCENGTSIKYEITHHSSIPKELETSLLLIPDHDSRELKPCNTRISGFLSISETVTIPETQYPSVIESKVPFPSNLRLRYVPFGADSPTEPLYTKPKKNKQSAMSDDESPRKRKSKKSKHKDTSIEDSDRGDQITKELPALSKKKTKHGKCSIEESDRPLSIKEDPISPMSRKHKKRKANSEDKCAAMAKTVKRAKIDKSWDKRSAEDSKSVINVKKERLSSVPKTKKSKRKERTTEDSYTEVKEEFQSHKKKSKGSICSDEVSSGVIVTENSDTSDKEIRKPKKHKKEK